MNVGCALKGRVVIILHTMINFNCKSDTCSTTECDNHTHNRCRYFVLGEPPSLTRLILFISAQDLKDAQCHDEEGHHYRN